jgi:ATP-binding cassette subfamily B protein
VNDLFAYSVRARLAMVALRRILGFLERKRPARAASRPVPMARAAGAVAFEDVSFRYAPDAPWALRDVSFEARPGEMVAVVGLSGSGKSTLFRLLLSLHEPTSGAVRLDGQDLKALPFEEARRQIGLATQDAVLFDTTIAENIRYGRADASDEEVVAAAKTAIADDFIGRLPRGYETAVGEGGADLSGGQRHRISLARVILKDAPVLLLDEVTAGLDSKTESELQAALARVVKGRTTIVIAHRLSTIMGANRILVMDRGRIVQQGTHKELYSQKGGLYRALFDLQFRGALESLGLAESTESRVNERKPEPTDAKAALRR